MLSFLKTTDIISADDVSPNDFKIIDVEREKNFLKWTIGLIYFLQGQG